MPSITTIGGKMRVHAKQVVVSSSSETCCCDDKCGCTNPYSPNYDPEADFDDGSCVTCCNQGRCVVDDDSPCKGPNCNGIGASPSGPQYTCCDSGCLPCGGTVRDCSDTFDNSFEPEAFCPGTDEFTYHDCYSCPQSIKALDDKTQLPAFLELTQILERRVGGPYESADERRRLTTLPETITTSFNPIGPGTVLSKIFALFGVHATPQCICTFRAYVMDVMGCRWCLRNRSRISRWLGQEARRRKIPYTKFAGLCVVFCAVLVSSVCNLLSRKSLQYG